MNASYRFMAPLCSWGNNLGKHTVSIFRRYFAFYHSKLPYVPSQLVSYKAYVFLHYVSNSLGSVVSFPWVPCGPALPFFLLFPKDCMHFHVSTLLHVLFPLPGVHSPLTFFPDESLLFLQPQLNFKLSWKLIRLIPHLCTQ